VGVSVGVQSRVVRLGSLLSSGVDRCGGHLLQPRFVGFRSLIRVSGEILVLGLGE
jgi:hypothetical protein